MKQAGPEFLTDVELNQEKASQTGEFWTEPTFYNHLNRVRVSVTTPEHSLHSYTRKEENTNHVKWNIPFHFAEYDGNSLAHQKPTFGNIL